MATKKKPAKKKNSQPADRLLPRITIAFFDRPILTAIIWVALVVFGALSYTTLLRREGFPSVNIPLTIVNGTYFVNDPSKVDSDVAKPFSDLALKQPSVKSVQTQSAGNFFVAQVQYKEGADAQQAASNLKKATEESGKLPKTAALQYSVPYFGATGGDSEQIDIAISFFSDNADASTKDLAAKGEQAAKWLNDKKISHVKSVTLKDPYDSVTNPATGQAVVVQKSFDRFGRRESSETKFNNSVIIGIAAEKGFDVIKLDDAVREALHELDQQDQFKGFHTEVSASFAPSIEENISELQRVLIEGLLAILVIGSIVIAIRASLITVVSMITVLLISLGFMYAIGYTLNVVSLFALILGLALIVDDTIIMVEAIDAARRHSKDQRKIVLEATRKISRAMVAATLTAALSFAPLLFVGGVLGSFIRVIPVTLVAALIISLLVALIFIPFFSRFVLLGKKQLGKKAKVEGAAGLEAKIAAFIAKPMLWTRHSGRKLAATIIIAVVVGLGFIAAGMFIARDVVFNIFPPTKDSNGLIITMRFQPGATIEQTESIAAQADTIIAETLGQYFVKSSYYATGDTQSATNQVEITPYSKRDVSSPELSNKLQERFNSSFKQAQVSVSQQDIGPPVNPFIVQIDATNRDAAFDLANDMASYMNTASLKRTNGTEAHFKNVTVSSTNQYTRTSGKPIIAVTANFDATDTTTLVTLAQDSIRSKFPEATVQTYGLAEDAISFDLGQESENQDSFKTLALAFPILLLVIYLLLILEFRSFLQPLLIFMAIPFSIFGVMLGLDITNNAISFFTMLGFFALVGLSIKNTILLTDYANQARKQGMEPVDAAVAALEERFRPLFATSLTAVVSLVPLAISSPFWQGLAVVLIFGLLSSTFLVITVFPYYYLGAEYLRIKIPAKIFIAWLIPTLALAIGLGVTTKPLIGLLVVPASLYVVLLWVFYRKRLSKQAT